MPAGSRAFASLTISFGLVNIPVDVYSGSVASSRISFNLLHAKDGARVKQQYICALDGEVVERGDMVKGFEFEKGKYVRFKPEEIKALEEAGSDAIGIFQFVPLESVDPVFYDKTYLLAPAKYGDKPYALLREALAESKRCAVGRWATRGREHIVIVRPMGEGLAMHQLFFQDEVRTVKDLGLKDAPDVTEAELKLARMLIDQQSEKRFDPNEFKDEFRERVEAAIQKKIRSGKEISEIEAPTPSSRSSGNVVDLMEMLQKSLGGKGARASGGATAARKPPKRVTTTRTAAPSRKARGG